MSVTVTEFYYGPCVHLFYKRFRAVKDTFINPKTLHADYVPAKIELARASQEEKNEQLTHVQKFQKDHRTEAEQQLKELKATALSGGNIFAALLRASRHCSLFQMSQTLYEAGGQYRRNL